MLPLARYYLRAITHALPLSFDKYCDQCVRQRAMKALKSKKKLPGNLLRAKDKAAGKVKGVKGLKGNTRAQQYCVEGF